MDYWLCVAMSTNGNLLLIFHFQAGIWRSSSNDLGKTRPSLVRGTHNLSPERPGTAPSKTSPINSWRCQDCWGLTHIKTDAAHGESWERCLFKYSNFICFVSKLWILKAGSESNHFNLLGTDTMPYTWQVLNKYLSNIWILTSVLLSCSFYTL